jgi:NADH oxidase (H2O2-forming)
MAGIVQKYIEKQGIDVILDRPAEKILGTEHVEVCCFWRYDCKGRYVILATGVRPRIELAKMLVARLVRWLSELMRKCRHLYLIYMLLETV